MNLNKDILVTKMDTIIENDIFKFHIKMILCPLDLYHLLISCKSFLRYINLEDIKKNTIIQIEKKLSQIFGIYYDRFKKIFEEQNGIITGSIIIESIIGKQWSDEEVEIHILSNNFMRQDLNVWFNFIKEINPEEQPSFFIKDKNRFRIVHNKIILHFGKKSTYDVGKYCHINDFCYKPKNQLSIRNIKSLIKKIDMAMFTYQSQLFLQYRRIGFRFYNGDEILSDKKIYDIFLENKQHHQIRRCESASADYKNGSEYFNRPGNHRHNRIQIYNCFAPKECFVNVLSPNTKHFHDSERILIVEG